MSRNHPPSDMAQDSDNKDQLEKPNQPESPTTARRLQIHLPSTVGLFSSVPSTERLLTSVLSGSPIILCVIDGQLNIVYIDGKGLEDLRLSPDQLVDHPFSELVRDTENLDGMLTHAFAGNVVRTLLPIRGRMHRVALLPVVHQNALISGVIFVATDATSREWEQSAEPKERPKPLQKDLVLQVTHELRTPLNSVLGFANLLLRSKEATLSRQDRFYLERIISNTSYLLQVIGQVLDLSLHSAGILTLVSEFEDVRHILEETLEEMKGLTWSGSVALLSEVPDGIRPIKTDRVRLKQVIINLVANALKYTEKGTVIVSVHTDAESRPVRIDVTDTGEGIPNERLKEVFEAFDRGKHDNDRTIEGVGLGLSIAQTLCSMLGYTLSVRSEVGKGSTFSIHLAPLPTPLEGSSSLFPSDGSSTFL